MVTRNTPQESEVKTAAYLLYAVLEAAWQFLAQYEDKNTTHKVLAIGTALANSGGAVLDAVENLDPDDLRNALASSYCVVQEASRHLQGEDYSKFAGPRALNLALRSAMDNAMEIGLGWYDSFGSPKVPRALGGEGGAQ